MPKLKAQKPLTLGRIGVHAGNHTFTVPSKCINEGSDVSFFLTSYAHSDIMTFLLQLTASMFPRRDVNGTVQTWELESSKIEYPVQVNAVRSMLSTMDEMIDQHPPDTGPRRFGNVSYRGWYTAVDDRADELLEQYLPELISSSVTSTGKPSAQTELKAYLMGSWGSPQRLDYGTGHELSFLAFLGCMWKLGAFQTDEDSDGAMERAIVLGIIDPYLALVRRLILTYTLEPAGSHGVWGLDDHSFLPYILGSAQLSPIVSNSLHIPTEGSLSNAPDPADIIKGAVVEQQREKNFYFGAIGFINDVKKGPFWEHSPVLYDVSGVKAGWAKINKGMIKMYNAEVLSKFPVIQHFPFGSLFRWEKNPDAMAPATTPHVASHTQPRPQEEGSSSNTTAAPWASPSTVVTAAQSISGLRTSRTPTQQPAHSMRTMPESRPYGATDASTMPLTAAPWATSAASQSLSAPGPRKEPASTNTTTRAPWAK